MVCDAPGVFVTGPVLSSGREGPRWQAFEQDCFREIALVVMHPKHNGVLRPQLFRWPRYYPHANPNTGPTEATVPSRVSLYACMFARNSCSSTHRDQGVSDAVPAKKKVSAGCRIGGEDPKP